MKRIYIISLSVVFCMASHAREYHVSVRGNDSSTGSEPAPFRTIDRAAQAAYPGDVITIHAGVYREWVNPPRGGTGDDNRIVYRAAPGERIEIKGSERITNWQKEKDGVWKVVIPNSFFGNYNPYTDPIYGDWFHDYGRIHHTGEVFLNNKSLYEMETVEKVFNPVPNNNIVDVEGSKYTWYCENDGANTTIWANFHKFDPNRELVEISVRKTCFYPEKQGVNYITISGFHISQAATQWAAPTAEQIGMIATHWNKGWIIEHNVISNSKCSGITLGKERGTGHNVWSEDKSIDGSLHYIEVTFKTIRNGWNKENIGSHIVRNNEIFACEQTGICGSMGAAFSVIEHNHIYNICTKGQFGGYELAGIKFHAAIDTHISNNRIHSSAIGIFLDWMTQGTRISGNLLYGNGVDLFMEVNHGPFLADNNVFGSPSSLTDWSQGGAYVQNLFAGTILKKEALTRYTPYFLPHSTDVAGLSVIPGGDNRFLNNLFVAPLKQADQEKIAGTFGLAEYQKAKHPMMVDGNVYYGQNLPFEGEKNKLLLPDFDPELKIEENGAEVFISLTVKGLDNLQTETVTTDRLGKAKLPKQAYEQPCGTPIVINYDFLGVKRSEHPTPGPFELHGEGKKRLKVW